jgi:hypothetical protein
MRNKQDSPLLCLPAELRNRIYELALGGLRLQVFNIRNGTKDYHSHYIAARDEEPHSRCKELHRLTALTLVCRQLYTETNILPFRLNAVHVSSDTISHLVTVLSEAQRNAIFTLRTNYVEIQYLRSANFLPLLAQLGSLKRVIVEGWKAWMPQEEMQRLLEKVKQHIGHHLVQVELEITD